MAGLLLACAGAGVFLVSGAGDTKSTPLPSAPMERKETAVAQPAAEDESARIAALLRSDDDAVFQAAFARLAQAPKNGASLAEALAAEYGDALASSAPRSTRSRALGRLIWMAKTGHAPAAQRVAAFERTYDAAKATVANSAWWVHGQGSPPDAAERWMEDGLLLAEQGDRPAMLDVAFAVGHGRAPRQDRAIAVETYLRAFTQSAGDDEFSLRIRHSASRGLTVMLNTIVEQKDQGAVQRLLPAMQSQADSGAADMQYYVGLFNECVTRPANLDAARRWYRKAAANPAWKGTADYKARLLGKWCPRPARA